MKQLSFNFDEFFQEKNKTYYIFLEEKRTEDLLDLGCLDDRLFKHLKFVEAARSAFKELEKVVDPLIKLSVSVCIIQQLKEIIKQ